MATIRLLLGSIMVVICFLVVLAITVAAADFLGWAPPRLAERLVPVFVLVALGIPSAAAYTLARRLKQREWWSGLSAMHYPKIVLGIFIVGYLLTATIGLPAVQTHTNNWAVSEYKRVRASGSPRVWENHPYIATYFAVPLLPAIVLDYHEYQIDGLYGYGGFGLYLWYGAGVKNLPLGLPIWVS